MIAHLTAVVSKKSKYKYKIQTRDKLKIFFAALGFVVSPATEHVVRPSSRCVPTASEQPSDPVDKSTSNRGATKIFNVMVLLP